MGLFVPFVVMNANFDAEKQYVAQRKSMLLFLLQLALVMTTNEMLLLNRSFMPTVCNAYKLTSTRGAIEIKYMQHNSGALGLHASRNPSDPH